MCRLSTTVSARIAWRATGSVKPCGSGTSGPARDRRLREDRVSHARATSSPPASRPAMPATTGFTLAMVGACAVRLTPALSLIHISEPTRLLSISYAVFCLKKKKLSILRRDLQLQIYEPRARQHDDLQAH